MIKIRKLLLSRSFGDYETSLDEFLVPNWKSSEPQLIGFKSGQACQFGGLVYIGKAISAQDIIEKMRENGLEIGNELHYTQLLESYLEELSRFKIGNILELASIEDNSISLSKVAERPPSQRTSRLP